MLFLGIKKIPLKEKYAFIVLEIFDFNRDDIHRGICAINWAESHGIKSHDVVLFPNMTELEKKIYEVSCLFMAICLIHFAAQTAYYHI